MKWTAGRTECSKSSAPISWVKTNISGTQSLSSKSLRQLQVLGSCGTIWSRSSVWVTMSLDIQYKIFHYQNGISHTRLVIRNAFRVIRKFFETGLVISLEYVRIVYIEESVEHTLFHSVSYLKATRPTLLYELLFYLIWLGDPFRGDNKNTKRFCAYLAFWELWYGPRDRRDSWKVYLFLLDSWSLSLSITSYCLRVGPTGILTEWVIEG